MKKRIFAAAIVASLSGVIYPFAEQAALAERGYSAIGGEEALLIFGIFLALYILIGGFSQSKKKSGSRKATAPQTESEQSESKSL
ncbi:MAG: hypothetical protein NC401_18865 [Ruminococcus sp.]|nr:hypothetical protein [Ruminococcus sp.]